MASRTQDRILKLREKMKNNLEFKSLYARPIMDEVIMTFFAVMMMVPFLILEFILLDK